MTAEDAARPRRIGPLTGIRVLDLTRVLAGPFCTMILGDLGAEIIKIEDTQKGDSARGVTPLIQGESHFYLAVNRNKKSVCVDLQTEEGKQVILDLAQRSDVLVENFRPDVMARLSLSTERLRASNSGLIVCSISGFGKNNSISNKPSFDIIGQALSGVMKLNGEIGQGPLKLGVPMGDIGAGLWAAIGILAALQHRTATGEALTIDLSLLDGLISLLNCTAGSYFATGESPAQIGNGHPEIFPYGLYPVKDGHIVLALHLGSFWRKFCVAVGAPELIEDARFAKAVDRSTNRAALAKILHEILMQRTGEEWTALLEAQDIPCATVLDIGRALAQPVVEERDLVAKVVHRSIGEIRNVRTPLKFDRSFSATQFDPAPTLGEHSVEVLKEVLGYDTARVERLARTKVIRA